MFMENFFFSRNFLMVYAIILSICNPLYILKINAEELIISEKPGFSSTFEDEKGNQLTLENFDALMAKVKAIRSAISMTT